MYFFLFFYVLAVYLGYSVCAFPNLLEIKQSSVCFSLLFLFLLVCIFEKVATWELKVLKIPINVFGERRGG